MKLKGLDEFYHAVVYNKTGKTLLSVHKNNNFQLTAKIPLVSVVEYMVSIFCSIINCLL